jgi:tetratricopeptide (TPR) repeat protein
MAREQGEFARSQAYFEESLSIRREIGDRPGIADSLIGLGSVVAEPGGYGAVQALHEEALVIYRETGDRPGIAWLLTDLGLGVYSQGEHALARVYLEESLSLFQEIGSRLGIAYSLEAFASLAATETQSKIENPESQIQRAAQLWGAAERLREEIGAPLPPNEHAKRDHEIAAAREAMDVVAFAAAWDAGRQMTLELAIDDALNES